MPKGGENGNFGGISGEKSGFGGGVHEQLPRFKKKTKNPTEKPPKKLENGPPPKKKSKKPQKNRAVGETEFRELGEFREFSGHSRRAICT